MTARVVTNSSTTSGRNCSAGFLTTVSVVVLASRRSRVKPSGMTTMAEARPFFIFSRPSASSVTVTRNIFFIWSTSKVPSTSFEARALSWSTRRTWMGGSWASSARGRR